VSPESVAATVTVVSKGIDMSLYLLSGGKALTNVVENGNLCGTVTMLVWFEKGWIELSMILFRGFYTPVCPTLRGQSIKGQICDMSQR